MRNAPVRSAAALAALSLLMSCSSDPEPAPVAPAKFSTDVVPILRQSCSLTACHGSKSSNLGIHLPEDAALVYAELKKVSPTANGVMFVVPGQPEKSYLMMKIDGTQDEVKSKCPSGACGTAMPPPPDPLLSSKRRDTIRRWIAAGAKND